ncbi:hypothetical protein P7C70_g9230, partial [Phenoliferia sp. Uapishka_3]
MSAAGAESTNLPTPSPLPSTVDSVTMLNAKLADLSAHSPPSGKLSHTHSYLWRNSLTRNATADAPRSPDLPPPTQSTSTLPTSSSLPPDVPPSTPARPTPRAVKYRRYSSESDIPAIMSLIDEELSEPYNIYTYRYFLQDWSVSSEIEGS